MKLFDRVTSKKIGPPMTGTIIGLLSAKDFVINPLPTFDVYPDWQNSVLAHVKFDKPQRPISFQEFLQAIEHSPTPVPEDELEMCYQNTVLLTKTGLYPVEDLEWI